tara:strand:+ start:6193 stop:7170 length:978 start_codon:yes stop_codon:yes gene_type:complete
MTVKIVWSTDWHVSDINPAMRIDNYEEAVFDRISQIRTICAKAGATICLVGGDVFHVKKSSRVRHALVARLIRELQSFPCPVYSIVGNHDISHNNLDTLPTKPLGVVFDSGALKRLTDLTLEEGDVSVRFLGEDFNHQIELDAFHQIQKGDEDWLAVAYHGYACKSGTSYPGETTFKYQDLSQLPIDDWFFGHWHIDQGIETIEGKHFVNIGSLTRGSLNLENIDRNPKAVLAVYGKGKRKLTQIKLRVKPAREIFDLQRKSRVEAEQQKLKSFMEKLRQTSAIADDNAGPDYETRLKSYTIDKPVLDCVQRLIHDAETELAQRS